MKNIALIAALAIATLPGLALADNNGETIVDGLNVIDQLNGNHPDTNDNGASISSSTAEKHDPNGSWEFGPSRN